MTYQLKYITRKKESGYCVIRPDGKIANDTIFKDKKEAEKYMEILKAFYE